MNDERMDGGQGIQQDFWLLCFIGLTLAAVVVCLLIRQQRLFVRLAAVLLLVFTMAAVWL